MHAITNKEEIHKLLIRVQDAKDDESDGGAKQFRFVVFFCLRLK